MAHHGRGRFEGLLYGMIFTGKDKIKRAESIFLRASNFAERESFKDLLFTFYFLLLPFAFLSL
jgi:hypothetical protein